MTSPAVVWVAVEGGLRDGSKQIRGYAYNHGAPQGSPLLKKLEDLLECSRTARAVQVLLKSCNRLCGGLTYCPWTLFPSAASVHTCHSLRACFSMHACVRLYVCVCKNIYICIYIYVCVSRCIKGHNNYSRGMLAVHVHE